MIIILSSILVCTWVQSLSCLQIHNKIATPCVDYLAVRHSTEGKQTSLQFDLTFGDVLLHKLVHAY